MHKIWIRTLLVCVISAPLRPHEVTLDEEKDGQDGKTFLLTIRAPSDGSFESYRIVFFESSLDNPMNLTTLHATESTLHIEFPKYGTPYLVQVNSVALHGRTSVDVATASVVTSKKL